MQQICEFCDSIIKDTDEVCPHCGAPNPHVVRVSNGLPKTIEELKAYAAAHNWPLKEMRVFIGEDFREARAFGIFEKNGIYTVYKNKSDGTRAVRYQGKDEAYAVNELYEKIHSEITKQKQNNASKRAGSRPPKGKKPLGFWIGIVIAAIIILVNIVDSCVNSGNPRQGYYTYQDQPYYYQSGTWYGLNGGSWIPITPDSELTEHYSDYSGNSYSDSDFSRFEDSGYYHESNDTYDSDWDSNDNWDSGDSWDSGGVDWDSDW